MNDNMNQSAVIEDDGTYVMDEANMRSLMESLDSSMGEVKEAVPAKTYEAVREPADQLKENLQGFQQAELAYGPEPEVWQGYQPMHEEITNNLGRLARSYRAPEPSIEEQQVALSQSEASLKNANRYMQSQLEQARRRNQNMLREIAELRKELTDMKSSMQDFSPEQLAKCIAIGMSYLDNAQRMQQEAIEKPSKAAGLLCKSVRGSVHRIYSDLRATPHRVKAALQDKAYGVVDSGLRRMARVFGKGLNYLQERSQELTNKRMKLQEDTAKQQPEAMPQHTEAKDVLDLRALLNPETRDKVAGQLANFLMQQGKNENGASDVLSDLKMKTLLKLQSSQDKQQTEAAVR